MKVSVTHRYQQSSALYRPPLVKLAALACFLFMATLLSIPVFAQKNVTVKGRVISDKGEPIPTASVTVKGTANGASSDANGNFTIVAPSNGTLEVSSVGYATQQVQVNNRPTLNIVLAVENKVMEQVVVVGYGTQRKKDVTGSVVSINEKALKEVPAPNVIAQLKGRAPGVTIVSNGATPGSGGQIRIRGNRTITSSQGQSDALDGPLLVLDGIPYGGSINDINPDDITNIEILKDASATAIFGSRGAGGVILITTKRGRTGKPVMSYDGYHGISEVMGKYRVFNGAEYAQFKADAATYNRSGWPTSAGTSSYLLTQAEKDALAAGISTDWQDLIYQRGYTTNHQLSLSGGTEISQFGLGVGYYNETGIIPNQKFERYSLRATVDHRISRRLKIGLNTL